MNANKIISEVNSNGGLDVQYTERLVKGECTVYEYIYGYIKNVYGCHGNTARKVAQHFVY